MAVVLEDPGLAPDAGPAGGRRWRRAPLLVLAVLLAALAVAGITWYMNGVDPLEQRGGGRSSGLRVRAGTVQGFMVAMLTADKPGRLARFEIGALPDGARVVGTKAFFLGDADTAPADFPFGCLPHGLNAIGLDVAGAQARGRFIDVGGATFQAGDVVELIAYVELGRGGSFQIPGEVTVHYDVGPFTRSTTFDGSDYAGDLVDGEDPPVGSRWTDCRMPDNTRGGA